MAKIVIDLDLPASETRAIELHHAETAMRLAIQEMKSAGGHKHGKLVDITVPSSCPGGDRVLLGTWRYEPSAER
ncbi:hypothetical protein [Bradyrhizobium japonicum]|uniref:hypothetical protein n=1 Tax=Bradyrhizobium japonicum TaxID=375 RepID=UPI001B8A3B32|nr:hypothetical protein [Bradyrhizobium japonicum]MBR0974090.1 hypothetical protein [Bradyrhizobium japonicum]